MVKEKKDYTQTLFIASSSSHYVAGDPSIFLTHLAAHVAPRLASKVFDVVNRHQVSTGVTCV